MKFRTKQYKSNKGITLIALVVTIVVLLILAGVSLNLVLGNNGIITKAKDAKEATGQATLEEQTAMNSLYDEMAGYLGEDSGRLPATAGTTPYLPAANFSQVAGTDLSTGLVIQDDVGNEYVWIEVPNDGTGPDYSSVSNSADYDNIESALQNYASKYRDSNFADVWYDGKGETATESSSSSSSSSTSESSSTGGVDLNDTSGCGLTYTQYIALKRQMLTSIYENGGFYIGRYEAGISSPRTGYLDLTTTKALSQPNQYPLNLVCCSEAQILAAKVTTDIGLENYTASLMFGIQWDLVLTYLEKKGTEYEDLATDSTSWGNYYNNLWTISNTSAKYYTSSTGWVSEAYGTKSSENSILLSTGADTSFSKMNIFDLAGNVCEWTLESRGNPSEFRSVTTRGGRYTTTKHPVCTRAYGCKSGSYEYTWG